MLVQDFGFTLAARLCVFRTFGIIELLRLIKLVDSETEESPKLIKEFLEDEVGVDFALAVSR